MNDVIIYHALQITPILFFFSLSVHLYYFFFFNAVFCEVGITYVTYRTYMHIILASARVCVGNKYKTKKEIYSFLRTEKYRKTHTYISVWS